MFLCRTSRYKRLTTFFDRITWHITEFVYSNFPRQFLPDLSDPLKYHLITF